MPEASGSRSPQLVLAFDFGHKRIGVARGDTASGMTDAARGFAREIAQRYVLPVKLVDERYSSLEAEARLKSARESGLRRRRVAKADVDAAAACVILERWFNEEN